MTPVACHHCEVIHNKRHVVRPPMAYIPVSSRCPSSRVSGRTAGRVPAACIGRGVVAADEGDEILNNSTRHEAQARTAKVTSVTNTLAAVGLNWLLDVKAVLNDAGQIGDGGSCSPAVARHASLPRLSTGLRALAWKRLRAPSRLSSRNASTASAESTFRMSSSSATYQHHNMPPFCMSQVKAFTVHCKMCEHFPLQAQLGRTMQSAESTTGRSTINFSCKGRALQYMAQVVIREHYARTSRPSQM